MPSSVILSHKKKKMSKQHMFVILLKVFIFDPLVVSIVSGGHSVERRELISEKNSCENVSLIVVFDFYFTNSL